MTYVNHLELRREKPDMEVAVNNAKLMKNPPSQIELNIVPI